MLKILSYNSYNNAETVIPLEFISNNYDDINIGRFIMENSIIQNCNVTNSISFIAHSTNYDLTIHQVYYLKHHF